MRHIVTILGNRPQFIKAAPVSRLLAGDPRVKETIIHTGQHFDPNMSGVFFDELGIPTPAVNLNINGLAHGAMVGQMMVALEVQMELHRPDIVLVYGDTDSTLAGALTAAKLNIPVAHVEAGVRSGDMTMPEELNRTVVDSISSLLFCVHQNHADYLKPRLRPDARTVVTGDVMLDAMQLFSGQMRKPDVELPEKFTLVTIHRKVNQTKEKLTHIIRCMSTSLKQKSVAAIVLPLHPSTGKLVTDHGLSFPEGVHVIAPVGYLEMMYLLFHCKGVVTDSGGLQREAYYGGRQCLVLRRGSEWRELLGTRFCAEQIPERLELFKHDMVSVQDVPNGKGIYGNGTAAHQIVKELIAY